MLIAVGVSTVFAQPPPASAPVAASQPTSVPADEPAVLIDGEPILEARVLKILRNLLPRDVWEARQGRYSAIYQMQRARLLEDLIVEHLLDRDIEKLGIELDDAEMRRRMEQELRAYLSMNGLTREQFQKQLREERDQTVEEFMASRVKSKVQRRNVLERLLFEKKFPGILEVTDAEIEEFYRRKRDEQFIKEAEVRASHILLATEGKSEEEKAALRKRADEIVAEARKPGADFTTLARAYSDCPSKTRGGDLNWFKRRGSQPEPLAELAFRLQVNEVGGPAETWSGYHIVKVTARRDAKNVSLDQARLGIRYRLASRNFSKKRRAYVAERVENAKIVYPPGKEPPQLMERDPNARTSD
jgi:parvulin-like peptidyl-prolyl isomerase